MTKKLKKVIEGLGWNIYQNDNYYELSQYSPAGEDFNFSISGKNDKELVQDIEEYYYSFEAEEHALMWNGGKGAPSIRYLLKDADDIDEMLWKLVCKVKEVL